MDDLWKVLSTDQHSPGGTHGLLIRCACGASVSIDYWKQGWPVQCAECHRRYMLTIMVQVSAVNRD